MPYHDQNYASAALAIHDTLVMACDAHPSFAYKNGAFASSITSSRPVFPCLDVLISSPLTDPAETEVFLDVRKFLTWYKAAESRGQVNHLDAQLKGMLLMEGIPDVFRNDQRARGVKLPPEMVITDPPATLAVDDMGNHVKTLLAITAEAIALACSSPKGYKNGSFASTIKISTPIVVMLGLLARHERSTSKEKSVFLNALTEVKKLLLLDIKGVTTVEPYTMMYLEHKHWFKPMLSVFEKDFAARGEAKPAFQWYTLFPDEGDEVAATAQASYHETTANGNATNSGATSVGVNNPTGEAWPRRSGFLVG
ncbi:hypothetical protein MMC13_004655 [Lambiella insularis]|nr:hypothetical protein [Lambiella insularis]